MKTKKFVFDLDSKVSIYVPSTIKVNQTTDNSKRIDEGIEKMNAAGVFSEHEIEDVRKYANNVRINRYNMAWSDVRGQLGIILNFRRTAA